jgi:hypothetical protein
LIPAYLKNYWDIIPEPKLTNLSIVENTQQKLDSLKRFRARMMPYFYAQLEGSAHVTFAILWS